MANSGFGFGGDTTGLNGPGSEYTPSWEKKPRPPQASASGSGWGTPSMRGPQVTAQQPATNGFTDPALSGYTPSWQKNANTGSGWEARQSGGQASYAGANANGQGGSPTDPATADRTARQTYTSLKASGHDVKWNTDGTLNVDGRRYTINTDGSYTVPTNSAPANGSAAPSSRPWSPQAFQQVVGRPPNAEETEYYAHQPDWLEQVRRNTPGGGGELTAGAGTRPSGGNIRDANYARQLVDYYAQQPGADPSLKSNPDYWVQKMTSGEFGDDEAYAIHKMETAWHDPSGGSGGATGSVYAPTYEQIRGLGFPQYAAPNIAAPWGADGPAVYNPGEIGFDDIPNFTWESLLQQMRGGRSSASLDTLMSNLLEHPESLDAHTVDSMKANMKDTLAEQGQFEDQNLKGMGATMGIADSPWLASERAASTRGKNQAIASGNQNIDIQAATTNMADKRAAAGLGSQYQSMRDSQVMNTVNAGLQRASITGNRLALRESVAQAAAASRQSAQSIMAGWLMQNANLRLSYDQLNSANSQFLEDLMMRVQAMNLQDQQFGSDLGFRYGQLNSNNRNQPPDPNSQGY